MYHGFEPWFDTSADYTTNAKSYYDKLAKDKKLLELLSKRIWEYDKTLDNSLKHIQEVLQSYSDQLDQKMEDFDHKMEEYDQIIIDLTNEWLAENMEEIMQNATKMVWFGLSDDGHFIAVIPPTWDSIDFDTSNNGELILQY